MWVVFPLVCGPLRAHWVQLGPVNRWRFLHRDGEHTTIMKFAILGVLIVLVISFFVIVWKAAKEWRWYQIVAACFTMLLAVAFVFPTAGVLGSRAAWHKKKEELETKATEVRVQEKLVKYGDPTDASSQGIVELTRRLAKFGVEAGRRWRSLQKTSATNQSITLVAPAADADPIEDDPSADDDEAAAAPASPLISEGLAVYGFAEKMDDEIQKMVPTVFLGEFHVTASTPTQVTLAPTGVLNQEQTTLVQRSDSWSLYEMLPLDDHLPFISAGSLPRDEEYFGTVDEELVRRVLGKDVSEATIDTYLRDGTAVTPDDPPASRWVKIEFLKNHNIVVDGDNKPNPLDGGFFDGNGRAVDSRLRRGEEASFKTGDQILITEQAFTDPEGQFPEGVAKRVNEYYIRPLNDYRFVLRRIRLQLLELVDREVELAFEKSVLDESIANTASMLVVNQEAKLALEQDLLQVEIERKAIDKYKQGIAEKVQTSRAELTRLHKSNLLLEQQLEKHHREIQQRIDAITMAR